MELNLRTKHDNKLHDFPYVTSALIRRDDYYDFLSDRFHDGDWGIPRLHMDSRQQMERFLVEFLLKSTINDPRTEA